MGIPCEGIPLLGHMDNIRILSQRTGRKDLLEQAQTMWHAIRFTGTGEESYQREEDLKDFVQKTSISMGVKSLMQARGRRIRHAVTIVALRSAIVRARARSYRSHRRGVTVARVADSGGDDGSGQGDPDPDPPTRNHSVIPQTRKNHKMPSPWPRHGCCCVGRWVA